MLNGEVAQHRPGPKNRPHGKRCRSPSPRPHPSASLNVDPPPSETENPRKRRRTQRDRSRSPLPDPTISLSLPLMDSDIPTDTAPNTRPFNIPTPPPNLHLNPEELEHMDFVRLRNWDWDSRFDAPGAGPSNHSPAYSVRLEDYYEDECEENLAAQGVSQWDDGLTPLDRLSQALPAEIAKNGGHKLTEDDLMKIDAFNFKIQSDITGRAFRMMRRAFRGRLSDLPTEDQLYSRMTALSGTEGKRIDCCINMCIAFTGPYATRERCPLCDEPRYKPDNKNPERRITRRYYQYIPLIPRLANLYRDPETARLMRSRSERDSSPEVLSDIFDGDYYKHLPEQRVLVGRETLDFNYFSLATDVALGLATDGFGPFRSRKQSCWPLLLVNYNLPKDIRHRLENMICIGMIPGPTSPKELDSFLEPLIDELEILARGVPSFDGEHQRPFCLRAYLIVCFGDMPAVAKLMRMKGHNGKSPCRACNIIGFAARDEKGHVTYYPPLSCPRHKTRSGPRNYDPLNLPKRNHMEFLRDAIHVENCKTTTSADEYGREHGVNGLTSLAALSSIEFPTSFPHDLMHVMFENIIPNLISLWTRKGKYKDFGSEDDSFHIDKTVWAAIGEACAASGNTIPAVFGCRVPNLDKKRYEVTAESMLLFTTLIGPAVLRDRFVRTACYNHFVKLVRLLKLCLEFHITRDDIVYLRTGFAEWVVKFEELYYDGDPQRIRACTLPLHALLHLADDIEKMGPLWCYWAFPMERFCGLLSRINKSQRFPYSSLDRYLLHIAQLSQIKRVYGLAEEFNLEERRTNIVEGTTYTSHPGCVFTTPKLVQTIKDASLERKIAEYLSEIAGIEAGIIRTAFKNRPFVHWGKMQQVDEGPFSGGDLIRAHSMTLTDERVSRNASYVKYNSIYDRWGFDSSRVQRLEDGQTTAYGRVEYFIELDTEFLQRFAGLATHPNALLTPIIVAAISTIPRYQYSAQCDLVEYRLLSGKLGSLEIIDVRDIDCLVGRVVPGDIWKRQYIVDRTTVVGRMEVPDGGTMLQDDE